MTQGREATSLNQRKTQHVDLARDPASQMPTLSGKTSGFDAWHFEHKALPEAHLDQLDLTTQFLGKSLAFPFLISSMTGGGRYGAQLNPRLAEACQAAGVGLAVGSERVALEDADARADFRLRPYMPKGLLLGNLGATRLIQPGGLDAAQAAVDMLEADGLYIHLNPLQEAAQPEGDRDWRGVGAALAQLCQRLSVPVLVKEVGHSIGPQTLRILMECGVAAVDLAGAGGTSWCQIESQRNPDALQRAVLAPFADWGLPTADALIAARRITTDLPLIASGGLRHGLDLAKAIALGANMGAAAQPFLEPALSSTEAVRDAIEVWRQQYRLARFLGGPLHRAASVDTL